MADDLILDREGEVASISFNRPHKRNALSLAIWQRLPELLAEIEGDAAVKVLVLRGAGASGFASGADISEFESLRVEREQAELYDEAVHRAEGTLAAFPKPSIAMVRGSCIGGGCELAVACDFRFSDETGRFGITASRLGIVYGLAPTKRLADLIGPSRAKRMLFTGEIVDAQLAYQRGLVDEVWSSQELEVKTYEFANDLCGRAQMSIRGAKRMVLAALDGQVSESEATRRLRTEGYASADYQEGIRAFLEKRTPRFQYS